MGSVRHERGSAYGSSFVILPLGCSLCVGTDPSQVPFLGRNSRNDHGYQSHSIIFRTKRKFTFGHHICNRKPKSCLDIIEWLAAYFVQYATWETTAQRAKPSANSCAVRYWAGSSIRRENCRANISSCGVSLLRARPCAPR